MPTWRHVDLLCGGPPRTYAITDTRVTSDGTPAKLNAVGGAFKENFTAVLMREDSFARATMASARDKCPMG